MSIFLLIGSCGFSVLLFPVYSFLSAPFCPFVSRSITFRSLWKRARERQVPSIHLDSLCAALNPQRALTSSPSFKPSDSSSTWPIHGPFLLSPLNLTWLISLGPCPFFSPLVNAKRELYCVGQRAGERNSWGAIEEDQGGLTKGTSYPETEHWQADERHNLVVTPKEIFSGECKPQTSGLRTHLSTFIT